MKDSLCMIEVVVACHSGLCFCACSFTDISSMSRIKGLLFKSLFSQQCLTTVVQVWTTRSEPFSNIHSSYEGPG